MILWCIAPFLLESPISQGDAPPWWVFTGALTCELFQSLSHTHISTVPVAVPLWVLQEHTLTGSHVKHRWPDHHTGLALCENRLWWPGLPFPVCFLAVPALCASPHWEYKATVCPSVHCCTRHWVTPLWLRCAGCHGVLDSHLCHHPAIPTVTPSHYKHQYCSFNFKRDVPRNWPLLVAIEIIKK